MRIYKEDTIALVIDIQEKLFPHILEHDIFLRNCQILIEGMNILQIPVLLTEQYPKGLGNTINELKAKLSNYDPIEKISFSCCGDIQFIKELKKYNKKNIIICGIETHVCVLQTVIDLIELNFKPVVIEDCIASRKLIDKTIAMDRMKQEGVIISSYESILFELAKVAGTDQFKSISQLVK